MVQDGGGREREGQKDEGREGRKEGERKRREGSQVRWRLLPRRCHYMSSHVLARGRSSSVQSRPRPSRPGLGGAQTGLRPSWEVGGTGSGCPRPALPGWPGRPRGPSTLARRGAQTEIAASHPRRANEKAAALSAAGRAGKQERGAPARRPRRRAELLGAGACPGASGLRFVVD